MFVIDQLKKGDGTLQKIALLVLCAMLLLVGRLWIVQVVRGKKYEDSHKDQSFRYVRIPAVRGRILDRNGVSMAENRANYTVSVYLDELRKQFQEEYGRIRPMETVTNGAPFWKIWDHKTTVVTRKKRVNKDQMEELTVRAQYGVASNIAVKVAAQIGQPILFDGMNFRRHYETRRILPFPITTNLTSVQMAKFSEQPLNASGLDLEMRPTRLYPERQAGAHFLGYLVKNNDSQNDEKSDFDYRLIDFKGEIGIEGAFDEELHGKAGVKQVQVNRLGYRQHESIEEPAEAGKNVVLTIDLGLQRETEKALRTSSGEGVDAKAAAVVMNVNNGDILAMASNPTFDPNSFISGMKESEVARLTDENLKPQYNRALQGGYPAGSIFKIISGLAELENGLDPNQIYHVQLDPSRAPKGCIYVGSQKIEDTAPAGDYDFRLAFAESSNSYFIYNGLRVGIRPIIEMGNRFFLGQSTGLPVGIKNQNGIFPTMQWISKNHWTDGRTANVCIGQEITVTPVQMAVMTSAIANGGKVLKPRLVQRVEPQEKVPNDTETEEFATEVRGEIKVRPVNLQIIRDAMLADTEDSRGSGYPAFHSNGRPRLNQFRVCGKTGTAEIKRAGFKDLVTWFVSYAPYENPRYAVVIMVESGRSGGKTCAPVAETIYQAIEKMESPVRPKDQMAGL